MTEQTKTGAKEKLFLGALESLFTGAEVEGDSGFVNLMRMKHEHFKSVRPKLMEDVDQRTKSDPSSREELFDKLYTFFSRYFCESGSIYFRHLPAFAPVYERVYEDGADIALSWKTRMLYYVKSDVLVRSLPVVLPDDNWKNVRHFYFDAAETKHKQNNERGEFIFTFDKVENDENGNKVVHLRVSYKNGNSTTDLDEIIRQSRQKGDVALSEEQLQKAINVFRRQIEADFFINKDAGGFLREQFDLWMYQYIFTGDTNFTKPRIEQLQAIKKTAYDIIDYISQFEDELRLVWEKPKFAREVNYVVTADKLNAGLLKKIATHAGAEAQIAEWRDLGLVDAKFSADTLNNARDKNKFLPLDTQHFKSLELEILGELGNLDETLDGEFVHSENWQALNTLQKKYARAVKCIYIDPPFNLDGSDQFDYRTNYKNSCWATMLENRLQLAHDFLSDDGGIFVRCDNNGNWIVRCLIDNVFGSDNFLNEIVVNRTQEFFKSPTPKQKKLMNDVDSLFLAGKSQSTRINRLRVFRGDDDEVWHQPFLPARNAKTDVAEFRIIDGKKIFAPKGRKWGLSQDNLDELSGHQRVKVVNGCVKYWPLWRNIKNNWTDIPGYSRTWDFATENAEELLMRCLTALGGDIACDFFSGSGTTQAVAQKLGRKWLGVEMGDHFNTVILPRMKKVLAGVSTGISKEIDYKGGGAFKYYKLEQYEDSLRNAHYADSAQLEIDSTKSPFAQYVFFADEKYARTVQQAEDGGLAIDLHNLYSDIDIAESLSNILGKSIRKRTADRVIFADDSEEKIDPAQMTQEEKQHFVSLLRPYLWWGKR